MTEFPRAFYESAPPGVCIVRRDRRQRLDILYANPAFGRVLGEEAAGRPLESILTAPEGAKLIRGLRSATPPRAWTLSLGGRWLAVTIGEGDFEGEPCFILWTTDISASRESEEKLRQAVEAADAAAVAKSSFLATMSHEIRTPMQSVYGLLELIAEEKPDARVLSMAETARTAASGLLEILDEVLDFARMDADRLELDMFEVPLRTLAAGVLEAMVVKARGKDVALRTEIDDKVPAVIVGDPKRLRQILMNLMGNALKFTLNGSVTLKISPECKILPPGYGTTLRFEVRDTGIGIGEDAKRRLFTPFSQADNSTSRRFGGTGLGLSICRRLVEHMGGTIGVDSVEGKGSTFWFEIRADVVGTQDTTAELPSLVGISILSVEDHPQGAKEIKRSLESMGATVETCGTYAEGIALARRRPFDVGIVDQGLPDGLGIDLIRDIMAARPSMGLIMYTARDDSGLQHSLVSLGVRYLPKPAGRMGLGEAVLDASRQVRKIDMSRPRRLLIVEDTASVRDVLRRQLEKLEVEADFADNGARAWEEIQTGRYGIVLTDLHMPEMDGYALVARIRQEEKAKGEPPLAVIVLTADVQMTQRHVYLGHGFDECLLKPVSLGQFRMLLNRWGLLSGPAGQEEPPAAQAVRETPSVNAPAVDEEAIRRNMGALDTGSIEMMGHFVRMTEPLLETLRKAGADGDDHAVEETAHSLKGAARSACCPALGDVCELLQHSASRHEPYTELIARTGAEFERVRTAIADLRPD